MKSKDKIFLSKSVSFAIEMVRASLRHTPTNVHLEGLWRQMNMGTDVLGDERCGQRLISLSILIHPGINVSASCTVNCTDGEWKSGDAEVCLLDHTGCYNENTQRWKFRCQLDTEGRLNVQPTK